MRYIEFHALEYLIAHSDSRRAYNSGQVCWIHSNETAVTLQSAVQFHTHYE